MQDVHDANINLFPFVGGGVELKQIPGQGTEMITVLVLDRDWVLAGRESMFYFGLNRMCHKSLKNINSSQISGQCKDYLCSFPLYHDVVFTFLCSQHEFTNL